MRKVVVLFAVLAMAWGTRALLAQTPPAYMVGKVTVTDQDTYGEYRAGFGAVFQQYGGEIVAASTIQFAAYEGHRFAQELDGAALGDVPYKLENVQLESAMAAAD